MTSQTKIERAEQAWNTPTIGAPMMSFAYTDKQKPWLTKITV